MIKKLFALVFLALLALAIGNPYSMAWIAGHLVVSGSLEPSDVVVFMRSSADQERVRMDEAIRVVERRYAPVLLVNVDTRLYYNQPIRDIVEAYLKKKKFPMEKARFCESDSDNTAEEAQDLLSCLQQLGAKDVIVVTSEYHTRRTRSIFRRIFSESGITVRVHPVYDAEYWDPHWWRRRRWAKTFFIETMALAWSTIEGLWSSADPDTFVPPESSTAQTP